MQLATPNHVIGRKPRSGFSLVLFLAFAFLSKAFGGDNGYDSSVQVRCLLVHVQHTGNKVLASESLPKPFQVGIYPFVQTTAILNSHHLIMCPGQDDANSLALILADLAV